MKRLEILNQRTDIKTLNWLVKIGLGVSFFIAIFFPPDVLAGKGMGARAPLFMATAILVPVVFALRGTNIFKSKNYPHLSDFLMALPFLLDTLGNLFGFYNNYNATDDVLHVTNWMLLIPGIATLVYRNRDSLKDFTLIGSGISAMAIIGWEAFEWLISDAGPLAGKTPDALSLSYGDTIGDLVLSFSGGVIGILIMRSILRKS